jgi:hypothetical protein
MKISALVPYSGEFSGLKSALLEPLKSYAAECQATLVMEYIGGGDFKTVEKAVNKLFYQDDVDVIIGYVGYRVMVRLFDTLNKYKDKSFIHLTLGEIIPYSNLQLTPPANYKMISFEAYNQQAVLGSWVSENLKAESCLMCTSVYDAGYSLMDSFRIGYHSENQRPLSFTVLKNPPGVYNITPLFEEIERVKPDHIHVILCGRELDAFINQFDSMITYSPSLSFAFPLEMKTYASTHPSLEKAYTIIPDFVWEQLAEDQSISPFKIIFSHLAACSTDYLKNSGEITESQYIMIEQNLITKQIEQTEVANPIVANAAAEFEYSATKMVSSWENPYLCI